MAEYRTVHTKMWQDEWFCELEPVAKLFFIYLFTNPEATVAGIYRKPLKFLAFECGLPIEQATDLLRQFTEAGKVEYEDGTVWVKKMREYQDTGSPKVKARITKDLADIPDSTIKVRYLAHYNNEAIQYQDGMDTVSIPYDDGTGHARADTATATDTDTDTATATATATLDPAAAVREEYEQATKRLIKQAQQVVELNRLTDEYGQKAVLSAISWCATRKAEDYASGKNKDPSWFTIGYVASRLKHQQSEAVQARASPRQETASDQLRRVLREHPELDTRDNPNGTERDNPT